MEETFFFTGSLPYSRTGGRPVVGSRSEVENPKVQHLTSPYGFTVEYQGRIEVFGTLSFVVQREEFFANVLKCYKYDGGGGLIVLEQSSVRNDGEWDISFRAEWDSPGLFDSEGREIVYSLYCLADHGYTTSPFPDQIKNPDSFITFRSVDE